MTDKSAIVDWYAFTTRLKSPADNPETMLEVATNSLAYILGNDLYVELFSTDGWELGNGRRPYKGGYVHNGRGIRVWFGGQKTVLVEFTGVGCEFLRGVDAMRELMIKTGEYCTRIDIAVDIRRGGLVDEIADSARNDKFKTGGRIQSPDGVTRYIGSRKSEKLVRVYEYTFESHPRYGQTRVEYEHKKRQAKVTVGYVLAYGVDTASKMIGKIYDWSHEEMLHDKMVNKMPSPVSEARTDASTLRWIDRQVAPAIRKLIESGKVKNPEQWLIDTFMPPRIGDDDGRIQQDMFAE